MKISFVNFFAGVSGGNKVLFRVMDGLAERGHDVEYHCLQQAPAEWIKPKIPYYTYKDGQALRNGIPESDFVVATWCMTAYIVDSLKGRKGIPVYYCQHYEPIFFPNPDDKKTVAATYDLPLNLITNSPWLAQMLKELHDRESHQVYPAPDECFKPPECRAFRHANKRYRVMGFASPTQFKGFYDTLLPAWQYMNKFVNHGDIGKLEFHLYGNNKLPIPAAYSDVPIFNHGYVSEEELVYMYQNSDLYMLASYAESSPLAPLEAMACGCPVLSTRFGTEHYGDGVLRCLDRQPREMAVKAINLLANPLMREAMSQYSVEFVKQFTWERTIDQAEAFFKEMGGD